MSRSYSSTNRYTEEILKSCKLGKEKKGDLFYTETERAGRFKVEVRDWLETEQEEDRCNEPTNELLAEAAEVVAARQSFEGDQSWLPLDGLLLFSPWEGSCPNKSHVNRVYSVTFPAKPSLTFYSADATEIF